MQHLQWWTDFVAWHVDALPMVLVTVVRADGSTPREVGTTMLLRFNLQQQWQQSDTIGGGHLEFQAIDIAKAMLKETGISVRRIERFNLSARLGQCCGGVMWLLFEKISPAVTPSDLSMSLQAWRAGRHIWRTVSHQYASTWQIMGMEQQPSFEFDSDSSEQWQFGQQIQPNTMHVLICGAGHVGEAIVRCLLPIGVRMKWIDPRDDIFPSDLLEKVQCLTTDTLEAEIEHFDRSGAILILTHDHQLDLQLCFAALKPTTKPFAYVGMIGSKSKRAIFEKRMQVRGYTPETLQRLVCPIGIEGISSKHPATIAIAVVAQLLQVFDVKK
ncbi:xanthine dehydrogenase accessory protein XdhC [Acinetobacter sp. WU_MDCI_Abxc222]|uniref:xanthine dehydrogenase accessory protein XdhC n=1 Tax=Acinetobacter sp. WU_MDCI_Abxc222 TaxID=2850076 RepID=UPI0021CDB9BC|nr:xanthine dehydrogenase accessory protein XdhC [Acinetobacter sp. WU_MDCI_Abxc222]MCU4562974.1 xanthine dehydrogenase accessory protein XdhC [Acinetobacter sp. WU_MDCI_Abxc222]